MVRRKYLLALETTPDDHRDVNKVCPRAVAVSARTLLGSSSQDRTAFEWQQSEMESRLVFVTARQVRR
jgi:hypothetical protein